MQYPVTTYRANEQGSTSTFKGLNRTDKGNSGEWLDEHDLDTDRYPCLAPRTEHGAELLLSTSDTSVRGKIFASAEIIKDDGEYHGFTGVILSNSASDDTGQPCKNFCFLYNGVIRHIGAESTAGHSTPERTALWLYDTTLDDITEDELNSFNSEIERIVWTVAAVGSRYAINGFDPVLKRGRYFVFDPGKMYDIISKEKERLVVQSGIQAEYKGLSFGKANAVSRGYSEHKYINYIQSNSKTIDFSKVFCEGDYLLIGNVTNSSGETTAALKEYQTYPYRKSGSLIRYAVIREIEKTYNSSGDFVNQRIYYYATSPSGNFIVNENRSNLNVTLGTFVPPMEHIAAFGKRVWGINSDEDMVFASVFDTPFKMMNTDAQLDAAMSWQTVIGTPDTAVGVFPAVSEMLVMKRNSLTRITGTNGTNFAVAGIYKNCGCIDIRSCAEAAGTVIYLGYNGFYAYTGAQPKIISRNLNCRYRSAVGFTDGMKYYASAIRSDNGAHEFLVYDLTGGAWHKWGDTPKAEAGIRIGDSIYLTYNTGQNGFVMKLCGGACAQPWQCESVVHYEGANTFKAVNELWIRCKTEREIKVYTSVNGGEWREHKQLIPKGRIFMYKIPVRLLPGDYWQYKLESEGETVIHNIERIYEEGGGRHYVH